MDMARFLNGLNNNLKSTVANKKPITLPHAASIAYATEAEKWLFKNLPGSLSVYGTLQAKSSNSL